jgi:selenocysteine-specific elongation factor
VYVVATAGHVDHGKSTLVEALTGTHPDRLDEERRRGLTITLGYCWTSLPGVGEVAFVDVPGHERFIPTMLSGVGPVPAVLFVVAADDGWMPQAAEHLAALDAFGVEHAVVAVTRSDLADPADAIRRATAEFAGTSLSGAPVIPVSAVSGAGLPELTEALTALTTALPDPDPAADVRLWVDRMFTVRGAGTVVTGTLPAGTIRTGDHLSTGAGLVRVRGVEALQHPRDEVSGTARVALNLATTPDDLTRDSVLVTPAAWEWTSTVDVRLVRPAESPGRAALTLHVGAVSEPVNYRELDESYGRLRLRRALPLRVGDRAILRDPGSRRLWGLTVADPAPPPLGRRGSAATRAAGLRAGTDEVRRRRLVSTALLRRIGAQIPDDVLHVGDWLLSPEHANTLRAQLSEVVAAHLEEQPLDRGIPVQAAAGALGLPTADLIPALIAAPLRLANGRVLPATDAALPADLLNAVERLTKALHHQPYTAPEADQLRTLGLDGKALAAAERAGLLIRITDGIVLLPGADERAATLLSELPQPFTTSQARRHLGSTRRVVIPLLERLDRLGLTQRLPDDRRRLR